MGFQVFDEKLVLNGPVEFGLAADTDWQYLVSPYAGGVVRVDEMWAATNKATDTVIEIGVFFTVGTPSSSTRIGGCTIPAVSGNTTVQMCDILKALFGEAGHALIVGPGQEIAFRLPAALTGSDVVQVWFTGGEM